jgi:hypothetical protein
MLDFYGGMHILTPDEWFAADPSAAHDPARQQARTHRQAAGTGGWLSRRGGQQRR